MVWPGTATTVSGFHRNGVRENLERGMARMPRGKRHSTLLMHWQCEAPSGSTPAPSFGRSYRRTFDTAFDYGRTPARRRPSC